MSDDQRNEWDQCDFCKRGTVVFRNEHLRFRQDTPQGLLHCRVDVAIGRCDACGFAHVDAEADAAIRAEVERARRALA
jgi:hypothetical protein